jgi:hypothetical protein
MAPDIDPAKIGEAAAALMDLLEREHPDCELVDVLILAELDAGDGTVLDGQRRDVRAGVRRAHRRRRHP